MDLSQMQIVSCATMSLFAQAFVLHNKYNFVREKKLSIQQMIGTSIRELVVITIEKEQRPEQGNRQRSERGWGQLIF
jgi:hypothetical protein